MQTAVAVSQSQCGDNPLGDNPLQSGSRKMLAAAMVHAHSLSDAVGLQPFL